jgi:hypothetical protein
MSGRLNEEKWFADAVVSEANGYRSREVLNVTLAATPKEPGTLLTAEGDAPEAGTVGAILIRSLPAGDGTARGLCLVRDAEVNDAYLLYGGLAAGEVNDALKALGIIVRPGVLAQSIVTPSSAENLGSQTEGSE